MTDEVRLRFAKAKSLLAQAQRLDPERDAEGVVHLAYYAMYHGAIAVLVARAEPTPTKHAAVIGQFGRLVKDLDADAQAAGRAINHAYDVRILADYDIGGHSLGEDARMILGCAASFLETCQRLVGSDTS